MRREKWFLGIGFVAGVFLAVVLLLYVALRYEVVRTAESVIKQDAWSGKSWCLVNDAWMPVSEQEKGWRDVDRALSRALNISTAKVDIDDALQALRNKYPVLQEVPTKELLQRIKVVYSNKLLSSLYLKSFIELNKTEVEPAGE